MATNESQEQSAAARKELEAAWTDLERTLSAASDAPDDTTLAAVAPFLPSDELVAVDEPRTKQPPAVPGQLLYQRHDSSMLFSSSMVREIAMKAMRGFAAARANALVTIQPRATATFVPIAVPMTSGWDKWLWRSLAVATVALVFFFAAALDLLIVGR